MGNCVKKEKWPDHKGLLVQPSSQSLSLTTTNTTFPPIESDLNLRHKEHHNLKEQSFVLTSHDRLQQQHFVLKVTWGGNFSAPVSERLNIGGARVLDAGCGPGTWLLDMASEYRCTNFVGLDSSAVFPSQIKPLNLVFVHQNPLDGLPWADNVFDFVVQKMRINEYCGSELRMAINELIRVTKLGGWVEVCEMKYQFLNTGSTTDLTLKYVGEFFESLGIETNLGIKIREWFKTAKLVDTHFEEKSTPIGNWGGRLGEAALEDIVSWFHMMKPHLCPRLGLSEQDYLEHIEKMLKEFEEHHTSFVTFRCYGRKESACENAS